MSPPAILKSDTVIPNTRKIALPRNMNPTATTAAVNVARSPVRRRCGGDI